MNDAITQNIPGVRNVPTIIFGADVTHPQPGDDSNPSIAAVSEFSHLCFDVSCFKSTRKKNRK